MTPKEYLSQGKLRYDREGQFIRMDHPKDGEIIVLEIRGWSTITKLFTHKGRIDFDKSADFQDEIGEYITNIIKEKLNETN